ncbi:hypothetical protein QFC21_003921 [Naganishia friedmannii]|uniref:Uncharacterized protein n=1 Tax=Naganishia friedmannii TaxID=89922 RepID=A0ACC2VMA1_9TREE|nr:hypothetical protein QFC21_003921 [Naganishia friedmannii]
MFSPAQPTVQTVPATATASSAATGAGTDEILGSLPIPLVRLLILLAQPIRWTRSSLEVVRWRSESPVTSWCVVAGWWALCLGGNAVWRYFLPLLLLIPLVPLPSTPSLTPASTILNPPLILATQPYTSPSAPATSHTLLLALSDLYAINALVPVWETRMDWVDWAKRVERRRLARAVAVIWGAWIVINALLGARVTLAIIGSIVLLAPSPFLNNTSNLLHRSLLIRRLLTFAFLFVFGSPSVVSLPPTVTDEVDALPQQVFSVRDWLKGKWNASRRPSFAFRAAGLPRPPLVTSASLSGSALDVTPPSSPSSKSDPFFKPSAPLYFRFELHENQRWWMGLDWTSALLPQERAAWCDVYLNPTSPPQGFTLPRETTVYLPEPRKGDPGGRVKRTATWRWVDEDWVVVRKVAVGKTTGLTGSITTSILPNINNDYSVLSRSTSVSGLGPASITAGTAVEEPKKGIAEQAFVKGLERLKARTMASGVGLPLGVGFTGASAGATSTSGKSRPLSGEFGNLPQSPEMNAEEKRKSSSASLDLSHAALMNATQQQAGGGTGGVMGLGIMADGAGMVPSPTPMPVADLEAGTDNDGWSYGDNKWEGMGPKGGMGKYTRRRRWQRRAICTEEIEYIPGERPPPPITVVGEAVADSVDKVAGKAVAQGTPVASAKERLVTGSSVAANRSISPNHVSPSPSPSRNPRDRNKPVSRSGSVSVVSHPNSRHPHGHVEGYTVTPATAAPASSAITVTPTTVTEVVSASGIAPPQGLGFGQIGKARQESHGAAGEARDGALRQRLKHAMGNMGA